MKVSSKLSVILIQPSSFLLLVAPSAGIHFLLQVVFLGLDFFIQLKHCSFTSSHLPQGIGPISAPFPGIAWRSALPGTLVPSVTCLWGHFRKFLCSPSPRRPRLLFLRYFLKPLSFQLCPGTKEMP